jgi:hypothetical protein
VSGKIRSRVELSSAPFEESCPVRPKIPIEISIAFDATLLASSGCTNRPACLASRRLGGPLDGPNPDGGHLGRGPADARKLGAFGCESAADVLDVDTQAVRKTMTVVGERLVQGRRGEACRDLEQVAATRKGCAVTRSFSDPGRRLARSRPSSASQNRCRWPRPSVARARAPSARNSGRPSSRPAHGSGA